MMKKEDIKIGDRVFSTKYCLTEGIIESSVKSLGDKYIWIYYKNGLNNQMMVMLDKVFLTLEEAVKDFEKIKKKKIISLERNIAKIENMRWKVKNMIEA